MSQRRQHQQNIMVAFMAIQSHFMTEEEFNALYDKRPRKFWVKPWLTEQHRLLFGQYNRLMTQLRLEDEASFINFIRMPPQLFDEILQRIEHRMNKRATNFRRPLEAGLKIAVTLRHIASGDKYSSLQYNFRCGRSTITKFVPEVCRAIVDEFKDEVISCPTTSEEWRKISDEFYRRWNVPHACGAIDGKHVSIRCPPNSGSMFYNYKGFYSIVLLGLVDADYKFLWVDCGGNGAMSDAQIYNASELKYHLQEGTIGLPNPEPLPNDDKDMPYYILGDDAFGLRTYLMKPYSQRYMTREQLVYNYRISRGRRVVENAFGIMASRWQILLTQMMQTPDNVRIIIEACVILHNLLRMKFPSMQNTQLDSEDSEHNIVPGAWRATAYMHEVDQVRGHNVDATRAKRQREYLRLYFNSTAGSVPWQDNMIS
ncbi:hypothetical protein FSP39_001045 [Pinctada imbricata]|uniref:DDE Tnp4 domain-containing protein n=1 Tax=Pinctada imbricata TaxID=66713 RepID=A0AA88YT49_PINIB|nr:hypothetical protein FSP39_001045 [Pinctada imbricata]